MISRIILWLVRRFDVDVIKQERINNGSEAIARGERWEVFYREQGGLADMILKVRRGYFEESAALSVSDTDKLYEYALADRLAREFEREVQAVIMTGQIEREQRDTVARQEASQIKR